jgi:hypothetical protein
VRDRRVEEPLPGLAEAVSFTDLHHRVDLHREVERQAVDAHGRAGVAPASPNASTITSEQPLTTWGCRRIRPGLDEAAQLHHPDHPVEVALAGGLHLGQQVDPQMRAARLAVSQSTSSPTTPRIPPEASTDTWPEMWTDRRRARRDVVGDRGVGLGQVDPERRPGGLRRWTWAKL